MTEDAPKIDIANIIAKPFYGCHRAIKENTFGQIWFKGGRGSTKCLGRGTKVVMYDGSLRAVEDVKVGEQLLGPDGTPRNVLETCSGVDRLYRVKQKTAQDYVATWNHILALERSQSARKDRGKFFPSGKCQRKNGRYAKYGDDPSLMTVEEYNSKSERFKNHFFGFKRKAILPEKDLPIDPYFLGVWLGDGYSHTSSVITMDPEIVECVYTIANQYDGIVTTHQQKNNKATTYRIVGYERGSGNQKENRLRILMQNMNLINNKHVPFDYKTSNEEQRLQLLAGMIDTDGVMTRSANYVITQKNKDILLDFKFIADSLGFKTSFKRVDAECNGKMCEAYRLSIGGDLWRIPCRIKRKIINKSDMSKNKDWRKTRIDTEYIGEGEFFGFELDGDHLFFLEDFTVTHNTSFVAIEIILGIMQDPDANCLALRKVGDTVRGSILQSFLWAIEQLQVDYLFDHTTSPTEITYKPTGQKIIMKGTDKPEKLKGLNLAKGYFKFVWFEELAEFSGTPEIRNILQTVLRGGPVFQVLMSYNPPDDIHNWVNIEAEKKIPGRHVHHSTYLDVDPEWLGAQFIHDAELLKKYDYEKYRHEYLGEVVGRTDKIVFNGKWSVDDFEANEEEWEPFYGLDFGFSADPNACVRAWIDWDPADEWRDLYIDYAVYGHQTEMDELPDLLRRVPEVREHVMRADSARPETISYLRRHGFPKIRKARKGTGSVEDGVEYIRGFRRIIVHPRCEELIEEFKNYSYKVNRAGDVLNKLEDKWNHGMDALRYALEPLVRMRDTGEEIIVAVTTGGHLGQEVVF